MPIFSKQQAETDPVSLAAIARVNQLKPKEFEQQYKDSLSGFKDWEQHEHAEEWMLFPENLGSQLRLDEVAVTNGELWTTSTNKAKHGKQGALVAIIQGTKARELVHVFAKLPDGARHTVTEVTMDLAATRQMAVNYRLSPGHDRPGSLPCSATGLRVVQDIRIELRHTALKAENEQIKTARQARPIPRPGTRTATPPNSSWLGAGTGVQPPQQMA